MIKPGTIGLSGGNQFIQRAIKLFTRSDFSHSFVIFSGPGQIVSTIETTPTIVITAPFDAKDREPDWVQIWDVFAPDEAKQGAAEKIFRKYSGYAWYGYKSYLWFIYRAIVRLFGKTPNQVWSWASHGVTCTELVTEYLRLISPVFKELLKDVDASAQTPEDLRLFMVAHPELFECLGWYQKP